MSEYSTYQILEVYDIDIERGYKVGDTIQARTTTYGYFEKDNDNYWRFHQIQCIEPQTPEGANQMNNMYFIQVGNAFVDNVVRKNKNELQTVTLKEYDTAVDLVNFCIKYHSLERAQKVRNEVSAFLGGADVKVVQVVSKLVMEEVR